MPGRTAPHFDVRLGTITIGLAFLVNSMFMALPNQTLMYQAMARGGIVSWIGWGLFIGGSMSVYGSLHPCRRIRQWGQCICFLIGWWLLIAAATFDIVPATPLTLMILGCGLMAILIRDVFAGVHYRCTRRVFDRRHAIETA